jgi:ribose transport system permease protein
MGRAYRIFNPLAAQRRFSFVFALLLTIVLLVLNLTQTSGSFGWSDQLATFAPLALAAMASTPSIISGGGGIDVSVSPLMTLTTVIFVAELAPNGLGGAVAVPILLASGAAVGMLNGLLVIVLRVPPVVVTLSMYFVLIGLSAKVLPRAETVSSSWMQELAGHVGPIPGALFTLGLPLLVWFALGLVPYRRLLYAVGGNDATAFASGVNIAVIRVVAYALGGLFAAVAGIALIAITLSANADLATSYTLVAIAAVALGGTSLWGGRGGLVGSLLGAASIYLLQDLLTTFEIGPSWLEVMYGAALVVAVMLGGVAGRSGTKPRAKAMA